VCTVCRLQGGVRQGRHRENVLMYEKEREEKANGWYGRLRNKNKKQSEGGRERR
jgi:hypothetical protein